MGPESEPDDNSEASVSPSHNEVHENDAFGDDFDDFEAGEEGDFDDFGEATPVPHPRGRSDSETESEPALPPPQPQPIQDIPFVSRPMLAHHSSQLISHQSPSSILAI